MSDIAIKVMTILLHFFVFAFGAVIGSFLNVVILRHNTGESVIIGGSKCLACSKKLKWHELIPVVSFFAQKGKCGECHSKISWQYPIIEITTGLLFLLVFSALGGPALGWQFTLFNLSLVAYYWIIFSLLIIIAVYDYYHQIIPNLFVWIFNIMAFAGLFNVWSASWRIDWSGVLAGFILFSFFALMWLVSRGRWMGFGDAKLALGIGWFLGMEKGILAAVLSFWLGAIVGVFLLFRSRRKSESGYSLKSKIAFGPFLVLGTFIAFFAGAALVRIFFHNFLF